jgi:hypothetical protein
MKKYTFFLLILGLFAACESPDVCTGNCANKRIRFIDDGVYFTRVVYDDDNRQTYLIQAIDTLSRYSYGNGTVSYKDKINGDNESITDANIVAGADLVTTTDIPGLNLRFTFEFDALGQQIKSVQRKLNNLNVITNVITYTWVAGNLTTTVSTATGSAPITTKYTYYPNINNTISNEFLGLKVLGKTSDKARKTVTSNGVTTNFTYDINDCGCITQSTRTTGNTSIVKKYIYELIPR